MARELSAVGQRLAAALVAGEQLDLIPDLPRGELPDEAGMRAWGPEHDLPAEELVDLLRGLRMGLNGCTYGGLPWPENRAGWVTLLREATPQYDPQPYQQLAKVYREAGHDRDVRQILMAQRRDQVRWGSLTLSERTWARFTGLTLGYGWQPWRALIGLVGVFVASVVLTLALGSHGALVKGPLGTAAPSAPCTRLEMVGVGLDLGTPVLGSAIKARERCPINPDPASATATALTVTTLILQFMAWALAALFIAGFTGAVRKT